MGWARRHRTLTAGLSAASVVLALSACGTPEKGSPRTDPTDAAASTSTSAEATDPPAADAADPKHAVAPPGEFDGTLFGDDLLVVSQDTLTEDELAAITGVKVNGDKGVAAFTQLSYGQFTMQNRLFNIAAVDLEGYRPFTGGDNAGFKEQWDRIAGGEVAVLETLKKELPPDKDGYLTVDDQRIHVGTWSRPGVDGVDAVVNAKWGADLGLPPRNAVLINTGIASPQVVRAKIEKAVGVKTYAISNLDIVAQRGLDLDTFQNVVPVGAFRDAVGVFRYTAIGGGRIAPDPAWVRSHIVTDTVPILGQVTCNKYMMPQLKAALQEVVRRGLQGEIRRDQYAGCYYPRFIAGSTQLSNHSFGLALDLNVPGNQRGTVGQMNREVVAIFKYWGFAWGGDWAYTDPMHFELNKIVNPG